MRTRSVAACRLLLIGVMIGASLQARKAVAQPGVTAAAGWIRPLTADGSRGETAAFVTVLNAGMYDVYLVSASTDVAGAVEFRQPEGAAGKTVAVKDVSVPAYGELAMSAGGPHLALLQLKRALKSGETITITLVTDGGTSVTAAAVVK